MNSFFASCEQQANYYLRGRPVVVCVYTGQNGCIISPSIEAKQRGVKMGLRLNEAFAICPDIIPVETHPARYREIHVKLIKVLEKYSDHVIPKSIDEAIVDISGYHLVYKDPTELARKIKADIKRDVGDWLQCSIGIAPNPFLAKLGTEIQKPNGLVCINRENIDEVLSKLKLTDLPGIAHGMSERLMKHGIDTPLKLRHASIEQLKNACQSIVGAHWHYRLNFKNIDLKDSSEYKSMQAMRQVSAEQRRSLDTLRDIFRTLCMTLERRLVKKDLFCNDVSFYIKYDTGKYWADGAKLDAPLQDGMELYALACVKMKKFKEKHHCEDIFNRHIVSMSVNATRFIPAEVVQLQLYDNNLKKNALRKTIYDIKDKYGPEKLQNAGELSDDVIYKDVIGFGSIKDL